MADDNAKLLIVLEAQSKKLQNQLVDATRTIDRFAAQTNRRFDQMNAKNAASFDSLNKRVGVSLGALQAGIAKAFAGAAALRGAQQLIDASTRIENSLKIAGLAGEQLERVYGSLFESAQRNATPVESLVELYGRLALVQKELGASGAELLGFTDNIAVALRVSGKSATESSGALLQLSQALGSGIVRAEEFNSILEGALPIAQAAAAGLKEAGGSVARLRALVVDGKVSSEAFFRAFEAGASTLVDKVANAEMTVSQQFIRLQNVLIDTAGKFDEATGASDRVGVGLNKLANVIAAVGTAIANNKENIGWFVDQLGQATSNLPIFDRILAGLDALEILIPVDAETGGAKASVSELADETEAMFAEAIAGATQMLDEWRAGWGETLPPELAESVDALIAQVKLGGEEAKTAQAALIALGGTETPFTEALGHLSTLVGELQRVRGEANATAVAVAAAVRPDVSGTPQSYAGQDGIGPPKVATKQVSLDDYALPTTGSGKTTKTPGQRFADTLEDQRRRTELLQKETAILAEAGPFAQDYGFAIEQLRIQQDLQNAATQAGIKLTPELQATINDLATGYASATVEAAKLAESQENARQSMLEWFDIGRSSVRGFIDDLLDGKSAADALSNALGSIGSRLIDLGLNGLFGTGSGSNAFGAIGKLFGFDQGGYTGHGGKHQPAGVVHKGEYVFNQEATRRIGVQNLEKLHRGYANGGYVGAPAPMGRAANDNVSVPVNIAIDARGADADGLARVEQRLAALQAELPGQVKNIVRTKGTKWR